MTDALYGLAFLAGAALTLSVALVGLAALIHPRR